VPIALRTVPVTGVTIQAPAICQLESPCSYVASVIPANVTPPVTYTWAASEQSVVERVDGVQDTVVYSWTVAGVKNLSVGAVNDSGSAAGIYTVSVRNPVPQITTIDPLTATAGDPGFTLTVTGNGFVDTSVVRWNGSNRPTTWISRNTLEAAISSSDLAEAGVISIEVYSPGPGGGTSQAISLTIHNLEPTITAVDPQETLVGTPGIILMVSGSGFSPGTLGSVVRWDGVNQSTAYVDGSTLTVTIAAGDLDTAGVYAISVVNPTPGGGTSGVVTFTVNNPVPSISSLNPALRTTDSGAFTLIVDGAGFRPGQNGSTVRWDGADRVTTYISSTRLSAAVLTGDVSSAGVFAVTVNNPGPGGGTSNAMTVAVANAAPSISGLNPQSAVAGSSAFSLTVQGSGFHDTPDRSIVYWNGSARPTVYQNGGRLRATIYAGDVDTAGYFAVTVVNPTPGGGTSNVVTCTVNNPLPSVASINPTTATVGGAQFTLTVNGGNFVSGAYPSVIRWGGANRVTTYVSVSQLQATIPASDISITGAFTVTVFNPGPGGGTTSSRTFTVED